MSAVSRKHIFNTFRNSEAYRMVLRLVFKKSNDITTFQKRLKTSIFNVSWDYSLVCY